MLIIGDQDFTEALQRIQLTWIKDNRSQIGAHLIIQIEAKKDVQGPVDFLSLIHI